MTGSEYGFESKVYESAAVIFAKFAQKNHDDTRSNFITYSIPNEEEVSMLSSEATEENIQAERIKLQTFQLAYRTLKC